MKPLVGFVGLVVVVLAGCSSPPDEQLMAQCSGTFECSMNGDSGTVGIALSPQGADCGDAYYRFHADGTVTTTSSKTGTWTASAWGDKYRQFDFTVGSDQLSCHSAALVTCVRTFQVTSDCAYNPGLTDTKCAENIPPAQCDSTSWTDYGAYCDTLNDDTEIAFTNGETCASLGY